MARKPVQQERPPKRTVRIVEEEPTDPEITFEEDAQAVADQEKLSEFLTQFEGEEYKVRVEALNPVDKAWEIVDTLQLDGFDGFDFCKRWADGRGGRFRLTVLRNGKYVKGGQPQIRMAAAPPKKEESKPAAEADPLKHPMVLMMMQMQEKSTTQMVEVLKTIAARPEPAKSAGSEALDLLVKLKGLEPKADDTSKRLFDALLPVLLERALNPAEAENSGGLVSEIKDAIAAFGAAKDAGIIDRLKPQPRPAPQPQRAPLAITRQPTEVEVGQQNIIEGVRKYVPIFVDKAKAGADVEDTADFLLAEMDSSIVPLIRENYKLPFGLKPSEDQVYGALVEKAQDPAEVAKLFTAVPELAPYEEWVRKVVEQAVKVLTTPDDAPKA